MTLKILPFEELSVSSLLWFSAEWQVYDSLLLTAFIFSSLLHYRVIFRRSLSICRHFGPLALPYILPFIVSHSSVLCLKMCLVPLCLYCGSVSKISLFASRLTFQKLLVFFSLGHCLLSQWTKLIYLIPHDWHCVHVFLRVCNMHLLMHYLILEN